MKSKLFSGFSLTEVMISMAVVGIIAAITVPVVTNHYQKQAFLTMLQKNYVELDENLTALHTENYQRNLWGSILAQPNASPERFLKNYYNVKQDCGATAQPCFAAAYSSVNNPSESVNFSCNGYSVTVAGGAAICVVPAVNDFIHEAGRDLEAYSAARALATPVVNPGAGAAVGGGVVKDPNDLLAVQSPAVVYIDTNGPEAPNISGRDLFRLMIFDDFTVDEVNPTLSSEAKENARTTLANNCLTSTDGSGCFSKIYDDNWKMTY